MRNLLRCFSKAVNRGYCFSTAEYLPEVIEKPFSNIDWVEIYKSNLSKKTTKEELSLLIHNLQLMEHNILPFNYDLYSWSCLRLIEQQKDISKDHIFMILRLSIQYKIRMEYFHKHIENEIFLRLYKDYKKEMQDYDMQINEEIRLMIEKFNRNEQLMKSMIFDNQDNLSSKKSQSTSESQSSSTTQQQPIQAGQTVKTVVQAPNIKRNEYKPVFRLDDIVQISFLLRQSGSKNIHLLQYLIQLLTIQLQGRENEIGVKRMLVYVQLLTYTSQQLLQEYFNNKKKYTARSIKRIYQFQQFYYSEHLLQLEHLKEQLKEEQIIRLINNYESFPIKKRATRKRIGAMICGQLKKRNLVGQQIVSKLMNMNKKDQKMKKAFSEWLGLTLLEESKGYESKEDSSKGDAIKQQ